MGDKIQLRGILRPENLTALWIGALVGWASSSVANARINQEPNRLPQSVPVGSFQNPIQCPRPNAPISPQESQQERAIRAACNAAQFSPSRGAHQVPRQGSSYFRLPTGQIVQGPGIFQNMPRPPSGPQRPAGFQGSGSGTNPPPGFFGDGSGTNPPPGIRNGGSGTNPPPGRSGGIRSTFGGGQ
jgi:hypothetical protein